MVTVGERERLIGTWRTDPNDRWSLRGYGDVSLRFENGGALVYTVHTLDKQQIILLRYYVDGEWLVTDQPSSPRQERAKFFFTADGRLAVMNGGQASYYVRQ